MKTGNFKKVNFEMVRGNGYGSYIIKSNYRGKDISVHTNDSEAWDWIDDDSNKEMHNEARKHCYLKIKYAYERM